MEKKGQPGVCRGEAPTPGTSAKPAPTSHQQLEPGKRRGVTLALRFLPLHLDKVGVGAKTSGSGECPFGDVRSPSTAPPVPPQLPRARCLRGGASPTPYIYSGAPHLFARTCRLTAQLARVHRSRGPRGPQIAGGHALTAPPLLWVVSEHAGGNRLAFGAPFVWNLSFGRSRFPLL